MSTSIRHQSQFYAHWVIWVVCPNLEIPSCTQQCRRSAWSQNREQARPYSSSTSVSSRCHNLQSTQQPSTWWDKLWLNGWTVQTQWFAGSTDCLPVQWLDQRPGTSPSACAVTRWADLHLTACLCSDSDDWPCNSQSACAVTLMTGPALTVWLNIDLDERFGTSLSVCAVTQMTCQAPHRLSVQ